MLKTPPYYVNGDDLTAKEYFEHIAINHRFWYSTKWKWWKQTTLCWCIPLSVAGLLIAVAVLYGEANTKDTIDWILVFSLFCLPFIFILPLVWVVTYYYSFTIVPSIKKAVNDRAQDQSLSEEITEWLRLIDSPTPEDIVAVNIGIFETASGYALYLIGSRHYDKDNDDWACEEDFVPEEKYLYISSSETSTMNWKEFQDYVADIVTKYKDGEIENTSSVFYHKIVTLGFDEGSLIRI